MQGIPDLPVGKGVEVKMKMKMEMEMKRVRMVTKMNQLCSISLIYLKINNSNDFNSIYIVCFPSDYHPYGSATC